MAKFTTGIAHDFFALTSDLLFLILNNRLMLQFRVFMLNQRHDVSVDNNNIDCFRYVGMTHVEYLYHT